MKIDIPNTKNTTAITLASIMIVVLSATFCKKRPSFELVFR